MGVAVGGQNRDLSNGYRGSVSRWESSGDCTIVNVLSTTVQWMGLTNWVVHLQMVKMVNSMLCVFYHNQKYNQNVFFYKDNYLLKGKNWKKFVWLRDFSLSFSSPLFIL
jgi:hypothetical protein